MIPMMNIIHSYLLVSKYSFFQIIWARSMPNDDSVLSFNVRSEWGKWMNWKTIQFRIDGEDKKRLKIYEKIQNKNIELKDKWQFEWCNFVHARSFNCTYVRMYTMCCRIFIFSLWIGICRADLYIVINLIHEIRHLYSKGFAVSNIDGECVTNWKSIIHFDEEKKFNFM